MPARSRAAAQVLLAENGDFRAVHKPGGAPLPEGALDESVAAARQRLPLLTAAVQQGMEAAANDGEHEIRKNGAA